MKKSAAPKSRTPILDGYRQMYTHTPQEPDVDRYISLREKIIYINTAARPDAKITKLIP
ncbi:MAG: hypothetical protein J6M10_10350 [Clostridia bacterium]|nr:hypothetical protein [Clostridia bacterium]